MLELFYTVGLYKKGKYFVNLPWADFNFKELSWAQLNEKNVQKVLNVFSV